MPAPPSSAAASGPRRLPAQGAEIIDRSSSFQFTFEGRSYPAHPGDTIASALAAAGVRTFSRSFKYHRRRGLLCCSGHCPNCLVQVGDEPNVRACQRPVREGLAVCAQNAWPSLDRDLMALSQRGSRLMPVGFYYKTFMRPRALWPLYERILRRAAGLGRIDPRSAPGSFDKQYLHADVAVVGGGPAGISAALGAARRGARVLLFDDQPALGGHLRYSPSAASTLGELLGELAQQPGIEVFADTAVFGCYQDLWLAAVRGPRLFKLRARALVVAGGAGEIPLLFDDNDLPGVMLGSAVQRLLHLHAVAPGGKAVVVTANDDGWEVAADLHRAGVEVAAVADERGPGDNPRAGELQAAGIETCYRHTIAAARGGTAVEGAVIAALGPDGQPRTGSERSFDCDLVSLSVGWAPAPDLAYMAGARAGYDEECAAILPSGLPPGLFVAGRANGTRNLEDQRAEGLFAGASAAAGLGLGPAPKPDASLEGAPKLSTSTRVLVPGRSKRFLCFCEDVTDEDVHTAVAEGYDSIELLKRYSTISMGPCQGRMCGLNSVHLCARANRRSVQATGKTTSRPPVVPVTLGALAGQRMEPVQLTPLHQWHLERGARTMRAGLWLRPEHYGDPAAEVEAVRRQVGLIDVSTLGKLQLTGPGGPDLLERIYANQWRRLQVGRVRYGVMCNDEGVVMDDGVCSRTGEREWYLSATSSGAGAVFEWMQWWMQSGWGEGVHLTDLTDTFAAFNLAGPLARATLEKLTRRKLANAAFPYMRVRRARVAEVLCRLLRIGFTGELSYEIHCPAAYGLHVWEALMEAGAEFGILPFGVEAQRVLRLEKAHIIVGQDTDALTDPFAANMEWAVKLDKKDFLGKRSLLRISRSGPRQSLVGFKAERPGFVPDEGLQVVEPRSGGRPQIVGWITSCRFSPTLQETIGLCWLPAAVASRNGASFSIYAGGRLEGARVFHGPFYDPGGERLRM